MSDESQLHVRTPIPIAYNRQRISTGSIKPGARESDVETSTLIYFNNGAIIFSEVHPFR